MLTSFALHCIRCTTINMEWPHLLTVTCFHFLTLFNKIEKLGSRWGQKTRVFPFELSTSCGFAHLNHIYHLHKWTALKATPKAMQPLLLLHKQLIY